jgi:hypothetical protein
MCAAKGEPVMALRGVEDDLDLNDAKRPKVRGVVGR